MYSEIAYGLLLPFVGTTLGAAEVIAWICVGCDDCSLGVVVADPVDKYVGGDGHGGVDACCVGFFGGYVFSVIV